MVLYAKVLNVPKISEDIVFTSQWGACMFQGGYSPPSPSPSATSVKEE